MVDLLSYLLFLIAFILHFASFYLHGNDLPQGSLMIFPQFNENDFIIYCPFTLPKYLVIAQADFHNFSILWDSPWIVTGRYYWEIKALQSWNLLKWFYGIGLILFGCTRTYKYSMVNETFGRSIITVLQSSNDVINFGVLYIPLGRMSLNIIKILPIVLSCKFGLAWSKLFVLKTVGSHD